MVKGIGSDIIEINRVLKACEKEAFLRKYFSSNEIGLFEQKGIKLAAGNFAVKEAVSKVFGTGIRYFGLIDIEVLRDELGKPYVNLYGGAEVLSRRLGITKIHVTISHTRDMVVAFALGEGEDE